MNVLCNWNVGTFYLFCYYYLLICRIAEIGSVRVDVPSNPTVHFTVQRKSTLSVLLMYFFLSVTNASETWLGDISDSSPKVLMEELNY